MKLPNIDKAVISSDKLRDYLLSRSHPIGRFKSVFFNKLGFSADSWELMDEALRSLLKGDAQEKDVTEYGNKYEIRGIITGVLVQRKFAPMLARQLTGGCLY